MSLSLPSATSPKSGPHKFFYLDRDKEAIEVRCATHLNEAIKEGADRLGTAESSSLQRISRELYTLDRAFESTQRGNARYLCAVIRRFAEAAVGVTGGQARIGKDDATLSTRCMNLRVLTVWACHPPLTSSRLEYTSHVLHNDSGRGLEVTCVDATVLEKTALELRKLIDDLLPDKNACANIFIDRDARLLWEIIFEESTTRALNELDTTVTEAKKRFKQRRYGMDICVGKHGQWRYKPACTLQGHVLLLFEAAEHLTTTRSASFPHVHNRSRGTGSSAAADSDFNNQVQVMILGIRMFCMVVGHASYHMPFAKNNMFSHAQNLSILVNWAAHADTWAGRSHKYVFQRVDNVHLAEIQSLFVELVEECYSMLDFIEEPGRKAVLQLAATAETDWRAALYLGLSLKDKQKNPRSAVAAAAQTGHDDDKFRGITRGLVCFSYPQYLDDSAAMLLLAETALAKAVDPISTDGRVRTNEELRLLDYAAVAFKELAWVRGEQTSVSPRSRETGGSSSRPSPTSPASVSPPPWWADPDRRVSKELSMKKLGDELLGAERPRTAAEELEFKK